MRILVAWLAIAALPGMASAQEALGSFFLVTSTDPMTDADRSFAYTPDVESSRTRSGALVWRCDGDRLELYLSADEYLGSEGVAIQWRFDGNEAVERHRWSSSTNGTAAFAPRSEVRTFTAGAVPAREVVIRVWDFRNNGRTYRFRLDGLVASLRRLSCVDG